MGWYSWVALFKPSFWSPSFWDAEFYEVDTPVWLSDSATLHSLPRYGRSLDYG